MKRQGGSNKKNCSGVRKGKFDFEETIHLQKIV